MPAVKISKFYGIAPKISAELLPDTVGQIADNLKTFSGDLIPYNLSSAQNALAKTGTIKTIYPMDDGVGGFKWFALPRVVYALCSIIKYLRSGNIYIF